MNQFHREYFHMLRMIKDLTTEKLISVTNCKPPCTSYKYDVVERLDTSASVNSYKEGFGWYLQNIFVYITIYDIFSSGYRFVIANNEMDIEYEKYEYDFLSLIAEFGGALGLFLGFSFYMLWDVMMPFLAIAIKSFKHKK